MKIVFFSPYLPKHFGGGEKYLLDCAVLAAASGAEVYLAYASAEELPPEQIAQITSAYEQFFALDLSRVRWIHTPLFTNASWWQKLLWTARFDRLYYQTDGSLFFSLARKNILHVQIPFRHPQAGLLNRLKLANFQVKNSNSAFTKAVIERSWRIKIDWVHQPFVDQDAFAEAKKKDKEKLILSVGRFFCQLHSKRQDVLVEMFAKLRQQEPQLTRGWKLVLLGKAEDEQFAKKVRELAGDLPIEFVHQADRATLLDYYQRASIYWHAAGFGIDEAQEPEKVEHFGISTLEAMAAGAVPIVINKGGQKEILGEELSSCLWNDQAACLAQTTAVLAYNKLRQQLAEQAQARSQAFSPKRFRQILLTMIK